MSMGNEKSSSNTPIFSRKKSLLTLQQYATSQGVSTGVVQECAKLGVVQVRKHKDRTFIVDLPLDAYNSIHQKDEQKPEQVDVSAQAERISGLVSKIFQPEQNTAERQASNRSEKPAAIPNLNLFAEEEKYAARVDMPDPDLSQFKIPRTGISVWKLVSVIVTVALIISIGAYSLLVRIDRNAQQQKLKIAYANIQKLLGEYENARQKAKLYELNMASLQSESQQNQKALADSQTELAYTRGKLLEAQKDLLATRQSNAETLKQLNQQINNITSQIRTSPGGK